ncbi:MAG TPA: hypothetical protein VL284_14055, partial [Thermoanaerobaculia bacterium]|nr:hypothetical protein [Thermoanaerobaculia bacterium]
TNIDRSFSHTQYLGYNGSDVASSVVASEDNDSSTSSWSVDHDMLGHSTRVQNARSAGFTYEQPADESGNVTSRKTPERRGTTSYGYDARGLTTEEVLPNAGSPNRYEFDASGAIKRYVDPQTEETRVTNDGLGRPVLRTYPDNSTEEIHYDGDQVSAIRDRQGRWLHFDYNLQGQLQFIRNDSSVLDTLEYDTAGRLTGWKSEDSKIEYDDFDAEDRPQTTRQIRYRADGSELDRYTQRHTWNGAGQRTTWTMPTSAAMGTAAWTTTVFEDHDAAGNVTALGRSAAGAAVTLMTADFRSAGRPKIRTITLGAGPRQLVRRYAYDDSETGVGRLTEMTVFSGASLIAGSRITFEGLLRQSEQLLGLAGEQRSTGWQYDDRGRIAGMLPATSGESAPGPGVASTVTPVMTDADFQIALTRTGGAIPSATFTPLPGHKIGTVTSGTQTESILYQKADGSDGGSQRTEDARFRYEFDERGRLRSVTEKPNGDSVLTRVLYSYDAMDRMVGRRVETSAQGGDWILSTTPSSLPPSITFVWDPVSDQLIAMFDAESGRPLRQFIHGGLAYDDPIEIFDGTKRYYPILDEAGTGSLQAVVDESGALVNRTIVADPYGEDAEALNGPAVDKITISGSGSTTTVSMHVTEPVDPSTIAGAVLTPVATPSLADANTIQWTLTSLPQQGNLSIQTTSLRSTTFGPGVPVLFPGFTISVSAIPRDGTAITPYDIGSLTQLGTRAQTELGAALVMSPFKAHPFTDPFTGLDYVRARWLDKRTGTFLSPDP